MVLSKFLNCSLARGCFDIPTSLSQAHCVLSIKKGSHWIRYIQIHENAHFCRENSASLIALLSTQAFNLQRLALKL